MSEKETKHEWYLKNRGKVLERTKEYYKKHRRHLIKITNEKRRIRREELRRKWGKSSIKIGREAEKLIDKILEKEGFKFVELPYNSFLDRIIKKNNCIYGLEATTQIKQDINKKKRNFLKFVDWGLIVLFISPSLKKYRLIELNNVISGVQVNRGGKLIVKDI